MKVKKKKTRSYQEILKVGEKEISYTIRRSRKGRHIRLAVAPEGKIELVMPWGIPVGLGRQFVIDKIDWLKKIISKVSASPVRKKLLSGLSLSCLGETYTLIVHIKPGCKRASCVGNSENIIVTCRTQSEVKTSLEEWYKQKVEIYCRERVAAFVNQLGVASAKVRSMRAKTRWGSCSLKTRTIAINWRLALAPLPVLDYVIAHEAAHLVFQNHSRKFWGAVASLYPNHKQTRRWLKTHGATLWL